jgi:hypothetical protein
VGRDGHDGPGAVGDEHVVGHPDRNFLPVHRVHGVAAGKHARLVALLLALSLALPERLSAILVYVFTVLVGRNLVEQLVLGRQHHVGGAEEGVGPRGVDLQRVVRAHKVEVDVRPLRPADPVALHLLRALRPVQVLQPLQQPIGVLGDLQHPLPHRHPLAGIAAPLALAVDDLLVRQHGAQLLAPPHRLLGLVGESFFVELQEDPLGPLVVVRVRGVDLPLPVVREAEALQLPLELRDVLLRRLARMGVRLQRVLLGGEAERVPPHRVQHVEPLLALVAGHDVGGRVALRVAHMEARPAGVRKHVEHVELLLVVRHLVGRAEGLVLLPVLLPLGFNVVKRIGHDGRRLDGLVNCGVEDAPRFVLGTGRNEHRIVRDGGEKRILSTA